MKYTIILLLFSSTLWGQNIQTKDCKPLVYIKGHKGSNVIMAKSELIKTNGIYVKNECDPKLIYKITNFECSISTNNGGQIKSFTINGNAFITELKECLKLADLGEKKVFFDNINVMLPDGSFKKITGLSISVR